MERRKALGLATTITAITASAAFAIGANFGLFGAQPTSAGAGPLPVSVVGELAGTPAPASTSAAAGQEVDEQVRIIDVPIHLPAPTAAAVPGGSAAASEPAPGSDFEPADSDEADDDSRDDDSRDGDSSTPTSGSVAEPMDDDAPPTTHQTVEADDEDEPEDGEDATEQEPCEVHDDGLVECHEHDDD